MQQCVAILHCRSRTIQIVLKHRRSFCCCAVFRSVALCCMLMTSHLSSSRPILKLEVSCCNRGSLSTCPSTRVRRSIPYDGSLSSSSFKSCVGLSTNIQARFFFLVSDHTVLRTRFIENQTAAVFSFCDSCIVETLGCRALMHTSLPSLDTCCSADCTLHCIFACQVVCLTSALIQ